MGYEPGRDIPISIVGARPGERLDEPLWSARETPVPTEFTKILRLTRDAANPASATENEESAMPMDSLLSELKTCCTYDARDEKRYRNRNALVQTLKKAVPSIAETHHD
jgi:FlaA1/EpsC-like NDP-sugar epimerase